MGTHIRLSFPCVQTIYTSFIPQSDQHLTTPRYIETTQVPPSPNWKMPNPRTGVDDGAFSRLRDEPQSGGQNHTTIVSTSSKYYQDLLRLLQRIFYVKSRRHHNPEIKFSWS